MNKINAVAAALLVTLGYDLIDYRTVWSFVSGNSEPGGFLLWTRPVNPILGAIFLFAFLLCVWQIIQKTKKQKLNVFFASFFLALMFASYFFSWGIALSIAAILILIYLLKKEFKTAKSLIFVVLLVFILASPYWYIVWRLSQSEWYEESLLMSRSRHIGNTYVSGPGQYLIENKGQANGYLFSNWFGLYSHPAKDFPDFSDPLLEQRLKEFPENYRQFMARDFKAELKKYQLDYILSVGSLPKNIIGQLGGIQLIFDSNNVFLYEFGH